MLRNYLFIKTKEDSHAGPRTKQGISPALLYLLFGSAWIPITSLLLIHFAENESVYVHMEIIKGWGFVFISAMLIHYVCKANNKHLNRLNRELKNNYHALSHTHKDLIHQKHLVEEIFNSSNSLILVWGLSGEIININNRFSEVLGYSDEIIGAYWPKILIPDSDKSKLYTLISALKENHTALHSENVILGKSGKAFTIEWSNTIIDDPFEDRLMVVSFGRDITSEREKDKAIDKLIFNDTLTSLGNRQSFENDLNQFIEYNTPFTVYFMGLDNFRAINEIYGHKIGDAYLKRISDAFLELPSCKVYRWSGDEFVFLQGAPSYTSDKLISRIMRILNKKRSLGKFKIASTGCVGTTQFPHDGRDFETLVQNMSISLERAKTIGKNQSAEFDIDFKEQLTDQIHITNALDEAFDQNAFCLNFQPIFQMDSCETEKFEVLLRWPDIPVKTMHIGHVIALAEKTGQILEIDWWVLETAFRFIHENLSLWQAGAKTLSINISAQTFHSQDFTDHLSNLVNTYNIDPRRIELEITEYSLIKDIKHSRLILNQLKAFGFKLSLDDFGTEYSSLNYLRQLPFDTLKIDKSYIDDITENKGLSHVIIEHIVHMAGALSISTVAEGIEHEYQRQFLDAIHCEYGQGYLVSRPISADETLEHLRESA